MRKNKMVVRITRVGIMAAVSTVLMFVIRFPLFQAVPFLEYTPAGVPILFSTLMFGTIEGLFLSLIVSVIQGLTVSAASGPIGILMQFLAMSSFVLTVSLIYRVKQNAVGTILSLIAGSVAVTIVMIGLNLVFTPLFLIAITEMPLEAARATVWNLMPWIIAFNAIKSVINAALTFVIFKSLKNKVKVFM